MKSRVGSVVVGLTVAVCFLLYLGCSRQHESSSSQLSGIDDQPNACTLTEWTEPLLDPAAVFTRSNGKPATEELNFSVPMDGELCVVVSNGLHDPPHGHRVSAAWIGIDGDLVIGPDPFNQNTTEIKSAHTVTAGAHELSVKLASKPGSFLSVQLMLLARDEEPPILSIEPADGSQIDTDMPTITVTYSDDISGVDLNTLLVKLNGVDVTPAFSVTEDLASWALDIGFYLEEGDNTVEAWISDQRSNEGYASSVFTVHTPTDILLDDLDDDNPDYRRRSAYKLLSRTDELSKRQMWKCLKQLNDTPEPKAVDPLLLIVDNDNTRPIAMSLAIGAIGEAAFIDKVTSERVDVIDTLYDVVDYNDSWASKWAASRALGQTRNMYAVEKMEKLIETETIENPPMPPDTASEEYKLQWGAAFAVLVFQIGRAWVRVEGPVSNPFQFDTQRDKYYPDILKYLNWRQENGGAP